MDFILQALMQSFDPISLVALLLGTLWGVVMGALPGMGPILAISICLPFTYSLSAAAGIALILGCYCGSVYGGSISAILINTPGTPQAAATVLDGFAMAQQGKAGLALGWSTTASVFGGLVSCVFLIILGPQLAAFALNFGPIETFAMILLALTCIISVSRTSMLKGLLAGVVGLFMAGVGTDPLFGDVRFDFDMFELTAGLDMIAIVIGVFALSEVLSRATSELDTNAPSLAHFHGIEFPAMRIIREKLVLLLKSSVIGTVIGILPGTGAAVSCFISYAEAKRTSPNRENMGNGEADGIIAPEAANNAVTGGALIPTLALGLPGDAVTAIMLATLVIQGITPGVRLMADNPETVYGAFITLIIANILLIPCGVTVARVFAVLLRIPSSLLFAGVVILCILGAWGGRSNPVDLYVAFGAGILGLAMRLWKMPVAPLVIGLVLGSQLEINLRQGLILANNNMVSFLTFSLISMVLFTVTACVLLYPAARSILKHFRQSA